MYSLKNIETFVLVVEAKSFSHVAKMQSLSRAAISKQIAMLEESLGITLLIRSTRAIALTEEGELIYQECRRVLENIKEVEGMLSTFKEEPSGHLSVVMGPVIANKYIIPHLAKFTQKYPKIDLNLNFRHTMPNMLEEKIDIVVGVFGSGPPDAIQRNVLSTRRVLCASPTYLKKAGTPKNLESLKKHPLIMHPISPTNTSITLKGGKELDIKPSVIINDQLAIRRCALSDMGIVYVQRHVVDEDIAQGTLVEVLKDQLEKKDTIPIHMYYLQRRYLHSKIRLFIDFILKCVNE